MDESASGVRCVAVTASNSCEAAQFRNGQIKRRFLASSVHIEDSIIVTWKDHLMYSLHKM
jgi:hypothetical protein